MQAKIKSEKVLIRGQKFRKLVAFEGIAKRSELPVEYLPDFNWSDYPGPEFALSDDGLSLRAMLPRECGLPAQDVRDNLIYTGAEFLSIGKSLPEQDFQALLKWLRICGARLAKINKRLAAENAGWAGEEEHAI